MLIFTAFHHGSGSLKECLLKHLDKNLSKHTPETWFSIRDKYHQKPL